mmetsp:Transcript_15456/g.35743  ORF Transcript_15456/g.35743 Transcript_15456/m.35743 type:complete len:234 (-) Transcript_15456:29-730(-)
MEGLGLPGQGGHDKGSFAPWPQEAGECARGLHQPPQLARLPSHDPQDASQQLCVADQGHCPHLPCGQVQVLHSVRRRVQAVGARTVRGQQRRPPRAEEGVQERAAERWEAQSHGGWLPEVRGGLHAAHIQRARHGGGGAAHAVAGGVEGKEGRDLKVDVAHVQGALRRVALCRARLEAHGLCRPGRRPLGRLCQLGAVQAGRPRHPRVQLRLGVLRQGDDQECGAVSLVHHLR